MWVLIFAESPLEEIYDGEVSQFIAFQTNSLFCHSRPCMHMYT